MKVLIAPDKFKGSLSAAEAADAIGRGVRRSLGEAADIDLCPVADGGEGTVEALVAATGGVVRTAEVTGPLGEPVEAEWGMLGDGRTAVIEMAQAAGLWRVPEPKRDPTVTTTFGVGELMRAAMDAGAEKIIVGIGGSATTDGGTGMAQALGVHFEGGAEPMTGKALIDLEAVDLSTRDPRLEQVDILVASDVTNPLTGPNGAAAVYGPQKGATAEQVGQLDAGLEHLASLVEDVDPAAPGMGAAGGLGFGLVALVGAKMARGVELVLEAVGFDRRVAGADWVLTGEGLLDGQSLSGKTCIGVAEAAARAGVPTVALVGAAGEEAARTLEHGLHSYHTLVSDAVSSDEAMQQAAPLLEDLAARVIIELAGRD